MGVQRNSTTRHITFAIVTVCLIGAVGTSIAMQAGDMAFTGEKTTWHDGFDRYDFVMDEKSLELRPIQAGRREGFGVAAPERGQRRCLVIVPKKAAVGNPWLWRGCYWDHEPQTETELLKRGFHIAFITPEPDRTWDVWYTYLTEKHGLSKKPAFIGMSKGGVNSYDWATRNPDKVSCIYADNPAIRQEAFLKLAELAKNDVPLLNVCGNLDSLLEKNTLAIESLYHRLNGQITVIIKEGHAHHPHSLRNPNLIADWIEKRTGTNASGNRPDFADGTFLKSSYYSLENTYFYLKEEDTSASGRGPGYTQCCDRYDMITSSRWSVMGMTVVVPKESAEGKPWVFRAEAIHRDAVVDQALLAKGFHIVVAPLTAQSGAVREQWDNVYNLLISHGFSKKPVLEGAGAPAGESYAWAIENPDKVSCIYAVNPILRSTMTQKPILENLAPLAKAGVSILHVCGERDHWFTSQTGELQKRYRELNGTIKVVVNEGKGHYPLAPENLHEVVKSITEYSTPRP